MWFKLPYNFNFPSMWYFIDVIFYDITVLFLRLLPQVQTFVDLFVYVYFDK